MTIRYDWCPCCEEVCSDHSSMCTVCGSSLVERPTPPERVVRPSNEPRVRVVVQQLEASHNDLITRLGSLRQQLQDVTETTQQVQTLLQQTLTEAAQLLPAEAMDPQQAGSRTRPTSKAALKSLHRIVVDEKSSVFQEVTFVANTGVNKTMSYRPVSGEFGPSGPHAFQRKCLVVASPRTGKNGLSQATKDQLAQGDCILYMERGDGVTFVRKAILGQDSGAVAVVVGNNTSASWPYVMKDSKNEATKLGLKIPVVMISQSDGKELVRHYYKQRETLCDLDIQAKERNCIICTESFSHGQTIVQLPSCGHIFHEEPCAMTWLKQHNTCPYCRRELPTDDEEYEAERRRVERTQGSSNDAEHPADSFYG